MEAHQDQQPTNTATSRPQQPTDAPAASLPTETLAQILAASLEGQDPWGRQKARMHFAQVCVAWYGAVDLERELVVKDTKVAERRAKLLVNGSSQDREKVRSLCIKIEEDGAGRGQRIADLINACPHVETLQLLGMGPYLGTFARQLGKPLTLALKSLADVKSFEINSSRELGITGEELFGILSHWPRLTTLLLPTVRAGSWPASRAFDPPFNGLCELQLPLDSISYGSIFTPLFQSGVSTLRHLDLGTITASADSLAQIAPEVKTALATLAPQLLTFAAVFEPYYSFIRGAGSSLYLSSTLQALRDVEEVSLGVLGFDFATVLPALQSASRLHTLSIANSKLQATHARFQNLTSQAAVDFINGAVALKSLTLPRQLKEIWNKSELKRVKAAAKKRNVHYELG